MLRNRSCSDSHLGKIRSKKLKSIPRKIEIKTYRQRNNIATYLRVATPNS